MNLKPIISHGVAAHETVCDVCDGNSFHIIVVKGHTHFVCANPICKESVCQINHPGCNKPKTKDDNEEHCSYCGSGLIQDGECQKCGL